jgi:hypothetical protein
VEGLALSLAANRRPDAQQSGTSSPLRGTKAGRADGALSATSAADGIKVSRASKCPWEVSLGWL